MSILFKYSTAEAVLALGTTINTLCLLIFTSCLQEHLVHSALHYSTCRRLPFSGASGAAIASNVNGADLLPHMPLKFVQPGSRFQ